MSGGNDTTKKDRRRLQNRAFSNLNHLWCNTSTHPPFIIDRCPSQQLGDVKNYRLYHHPILGRLNCLKCYHRTNYPLIQLLSF